MDFWYNKIQCDNCGQTFSSDGIQLTIFLYGIFFLVGKEHDYIGTTCPSCLQTIYGKVNRQYLAQAVEGFSSIVSIGDCEIHEPLRYFAPFTTTPYFNPLLKEFGIASTYSVLSDNEALDIVDQTITEYLSEDPDLEENYYRSCTSRLPAATGSFLNVFWIEKDQVEDLIQLEQKKNVRIFPRYIHKCSLLNLTDKYSWQYYLKDKYFQDSDTSMREGFELIEELGLSPREYCGCGHFIPVTIPDSKKVLLEKLKKIGMFPEYEEEDTEFISMMKERGISIKEKEIPKLLTFIVTDNKTLALLKENGFLLEEPDLSSPDHYTENSEQHKKWLEEEFSLTSNFQKILIKDLEPREIPFSLRKKGQDFWKIKHPFAKMDLPSSVDELNTINVIPPEREQERQKQIDSAKKYFHKGYAQDYLREHYLDFIKEYVALLQQSSFAYADLWLLKNEYLARYYDYIETKRCEEVDYSIFKEGKAWKIIFNGQATGGLRDNGFEFIHYLVSRSGETFTTNELAKLDFVSVGHAVAKPDYDNMSSGSKESGGNDVRNLTDGQTLREYKERLRELATERNMAEEENDQDLLREIDRETEFIGKELSKSSSWKGVIRKDETTNEARNKKRIVKAIERAVKSLKPFDKEAFNHFSAALKPINSPTQCYSPAKKYDWHLKR